MVKISSRSTSSQMCITDVGAGRGNNRGGGGARAGAGGGGGSKRTGAGSHGADGVSNISKVCRVRVMEVGLKRRARARESSLTVIIEVGLGGRVNEIRHLVCARVSVSVGCVFFGPCGATSFVWLFEQNSVFKFSVPWWGVVGSREGKRWRVSGDVLSPTAGKRGIINCIKLCFMPTK